MTNAFIHSRSSLENRTLIPDQMGRQSLYPFSDENGAKKNTLWGGKCLCGLYRYKGADALESSLTPRTKLLARLNSFFQHYFQRE